MKIELEEFDVLVLTETWWIKAFPDSVVQLNNYNLAVRCDREDLPRVIDLKKKKQTGGGVAIYVKSHIKYHSPVTQNVNNYGQMAAIKIKDAQIAAIYRKPCNNEQYDKRFKEVLSSKLTSDNLIMMGDTNLPGTDWINGVFPTRPSKIWRDLCEEMSMQQLVNSPTHTKGNQLDSIFTRSSNNNMIVSTPMIDRYLFSDFSDHYSIVTDIKIVMPKIVTRREIFDEKRMDWENFEKTVEGQRIIPKVDRAGGGEDKWQIIHDSLSFARESSCPKIKIGGSKAPQWINLHLQRYMRKEQRLRKLVKLPASGKVKRARQNKWRYHHQRLKKMVSEARITFEKKQLAEGAKNPKILFNKMKKAKRSSNVSPPINDANNKPLINDSDKANEFQNRFVGVFTKDEDESPMVWDLNWGLNTVVYTPAKVKKAIKELKNGTAPGGDGLGPALFKNGGLSLTFALTDLYNHMMQTGDFPESFLTSKVIPLWKQKGDISDADKYRCVTIGQTGLKIGERVVLSEIDDHFDRFNLNDPWQHGFQKRKSTVTNLVDSWDFISDQVDKGHSWVSLSVDFSQAFDKISVKHLLLALKKRGIGGNLGAWVEKWLRNRKQYVQVGEEKSRIEKCSSGTPQGSQSGPRFFCTVLSDIFEDLAHVGASINLKLTCYADDSRILFQCRNQRESSIVQEVIDHMYSKIKAAGLQVNASKSVLVYYGTKNYIHPIYMDGNEVPVCKQSLELGCLFSSNLSFTAQLERNMQKASNFVFMIRNTMKCRSRDVLKTLYQVYFLPTLLYGVQVWLNPQAQTKAALLKAYRNFWRLGNGIITPPEDILDPYQMALKLTLTFLFQIRKNETALDFDGMFRIRTTQRTRSEVREEIYIPQYKHDYRGNTFSINIAKIFNNLPIDIQNCKTTSSFKVALKDHLLKSDPTPNYDLRHWKKRRLV